MKKRVFGMLLCVCMLVILMCIPSFAAGAVRAGEKATVITTWQVFEKPDSKSKVTGYLSAGNEVDVLEAYIEGKGGIDGRWHKISYTNKMLNLSGTGSVEAMYSSSKEAFETKHTVEPEKVSASVFVDTPLAGNMPDESVAGITDKDMYVDDCTWKGEFNADGSFKEGEKYTVVITVKLKDTAENKIFSSRTADHGVNRFPPTIWLSDGNRTVQLTYKFTETKAPEVENENMPKKPESTACTPVKVEDFEAGDYGTMTLVSGEYAIYHEPDSRTMYGTSQKTDTTIYVLEAGIDGVDNDAVYFAVWNDRLEEIDYINMNDAKATFGNFVKEGNDPARTHHEEFVEKRYKFREITQIEVDFLH
ncbi:MAG: hypothetical protein IJZ20_02065, partial [Clostridia bacterium]|nr:hypothetical protein [Clostridia bacterium]